MTSISADRLGSSPVDADVITQRFWDWALTRWQEPEFAASLLRLQDQHGVVVLELLLLVWLGEQGMLIEESVGRALFDRTRPWVTDVVVMLRATRRRWRAEGEMENAEKTLLRQSLAQLELQAERALATLYIHYLVGCAGLAERVVPSVPASTRTYACRHNLQWGLRAVTPSLPDDQITAAMTDLDRFIN